MPAGELGRGQAITACELDLLEGDSAAAGSDKDSFVVCGQYRSSGLILRTSNFCLMDFQECWHILQQDMRVRPGPGCHRANPPLNFLGWFVPVDFTIFPGKLRRVGRESVVLFLRLKSPECEAD